MKHMVRVISLFLAALCLSLPAMADHSRIPGDGIMDETAAVDAAVAYLCQSLGFGEEKVRGKFYYRTLCYESGWKFKGPVWSMTVIDPTVNEDGRTLVSYNYEINALTGEVLDEGTSDSGWFVMELKDTPVIPCKDWVQPAEAIDRASKSVYRYQAIQNTDELTYPFFDIANYAQLLAKETDDAEMKAISATIDNAFEEAFVHYRDVNNSKQHLDHYTLSICLLRELFYTFDYQTKLPQLNALNNYNEGYEKCDFHSLTGWGNWLNTNQQALDSNPQNGSGGKLE